MTRSFLNHSFDMREGRASRSLQCENTPRIFATSTHNFWIHMVILIYVMPSNCLNVVILLPAVFMNTRFQKLYKWSCPAMACERYVL